MHGMKCCLVWENRAGGNGKITGFSLLILTSLRWPEHSYSLLLYPNPLFKDVRPVSGNGDVTPELMS